MCLMSLMWIALFDVVDGFDVVDIVDVEKGEASTSICLKDPRIL